MTDTAPKPIVVKSVEDDRTPEQAARAAPISLPAGSFDLEALEKATKPTTAAKHDKDRDEVQQMVVAALNETPTPEYQGGLMPGYTRVDTTVEDLDVVESRIVFDPKAHAKIEAAAEEAAANTDTAAAPPAAASS